jgi:hypothetical protein
VDLQKIRELGPYDIVVDDGSHVSMHQQVSLLHLWDAVQPDGLYIIEDLHYQPAPTDDVTTREMLKAWSSGHAMSTKYISEADAARIAGEIQKIQFFDSASTLWSHADTKNALVAITKRRVVSPLPAFDLLQPKAVPAFDLLQPKATPAFDLLQPKAIPAFDFIRAQTAAAPLSPHLIYYRPKQWWSR